MLDITIHTTPSTLHTWQRSLPTRGTIDGHQHTGCHPRPLPSLHRSPPPNPDRHPSPSASNRPSSANSVATPCTRAISPSSPASPPQAAADDAEVPTIADPKTPRPRNPNPPVR